MKQKTSRRIIDYIKNSGQVRAKEITDHLGSIGSRAVRKQLKKLLEERVLHKIGRPPKVFYLLALRSPDKTAEHTIDERIRRTIKERYLYISPAGEELPGWEGFTAWCRKTKQDPIRLSAVYAATLKKYDAFRARGLIDGIPKLRRTFPSVYLDRLFYLDFYSIEQFGKTKLGQTLLYAKQSQNPLLIRRLIMEIRPRIISVARRFSVDGILFIPPSVKREIQLMRELENHLRLSIRTLRVTKVKTPIIIPQKTLIKLEDRIENAARTIVVEDTGSYNNILLIDDAVGSGATLNETAKQIRTKGLSKRRIIGLAITGSFKGFDVISEV
ncbi:MAG TPA: hypothetical protein VJB96_00010 [Patescibacteria group bacterium]|nr:hypothetical protein [Patescibacteria group bacterium]